MTKDEALAEHPAQQEPVAWIRWEWNRSGLRSLTFSKPDELPLAEEATGVVYDPLYTSSPAQRTWVGLTIGEIQDLIQFKEHSPFALAEDIEAILKEKNT